MLKYLFRKTYKEKLEEALHKVAEKDAGIARELKYLSKLKELANGFFSDWDICEHHITNGKYKFWIANANAAGSSFRDEGEPFLKHFTKQERLIFWKEVRLEIKRRRAPDNCRKATIIAEMEEKLNNNSDE